MVAGTLILTDTINNVVRQHLRERERAHGRDGQADRDGRGLARGGAARVQRRACFRRCKQVRRRRRGRGLDLRYTIAILGDDGKRIGPHGPAAHRRQRRSRALHALDLHAGPPAAVAGRGRVRQLHRQGGEVQARRAGARRRAGRASRRTGSSASASSGTAPRSAARASPSSRSRRRSA